MVSALGVGREQVWQNLVDGRCGIGPVTLFDTSRLPEPAGGRAARTISPRVTLRLSNDVAGRVVTRLPSWRRVKRSRMPASRPAASTPHRTGVMLGAGTSDLLRNEEFLAEARAKGVARARPSKIFNFFSNTPVDVVGSRFGLSGPRHCVVAACSSSTIALGYAADAIRAGTVDTILAGGADVLCRLTFSGFNALRLVDTEPCRPFDAGRQGMTIGEGASVLVLEDLDRARARGAQIYAELAGYSAACEAYHPTSPEPDGQTIATTIEAALADACLPADAVDHINAHGTGTMHNDRAEARAFHHVFRDRAASLPVNATKSMTGHCLGAAGAD